MRIRSSPEPLKVSRSLRAKLLQSSELLPASLAEPGVLQIDHHVDETLHLPHLFPHFQAGELPPDPSHAHGNIWHDSPHRRLLRTGFLRQHLPVHSGIQIMASQAAGTLYQPRQLPFLHRGRQHRHQRPGDRDPSARARQDAAHPARSHGTHGTDPAGDGVSGGVPPRQPTGDSPLNPPQSHGLHDRQAGPHGIPRSRDRDRPAVQVSLPSAAFPPDDF